MRSRAIAFFLGVALGAGPAWVFEWVTGWSGTFVPIMMFTALGCLWFAERKEWVPPAKKLGQPTTLFPRE